MEAKEKKQIRSDAVRHALFIAFEWIAIISVILVVVAMAMTYIFRLVRVDGNSMEPSLFNNDRLLLSYSDTVYQTGDIIVIDRYTEEPLIKRVIAVGGDDVTVEIRDSKIYINDQELTEDYSVNSSVGEYYPKTEVPNGYLFVLGDNRDESKDSRSEDIGLISVNDVIGKATYRIWPPTRFGSVE